ncbi:response regulator [Rhodococcus oxybenzonivorans]|uniref:response regulator n=1 Tax=Rhodococcus oxybenzonivorans TaxID=1990687 RepID=UPI0029534A1D|nr:response regulator [Rhodococcus oxybenzonivorans]MDV7357552.1 response regulator [Rhodococcus oxybenzonivorans]
MTTTTTAAENIQHAGPSIMIIDPDRRVRSALRRLLEASHSNASIVEAGNAATALAESRSRSFDLILVDTLVPDLRGSCELIRHISDQRTTAVVALGVRQDDAASAVSAGARAFIRKTASSEQLLSVVRAASARPFDTSHQSDSSAVPHGNDDWSTS